MPHICTLRWHLIIMCNIHFLIFKVFAVRSQKKSCLINAHFKFRNVIAFDFKGRAFFFFFFFSSFVEKKASQHFQVQMNIVLVACVDSTEDTSTNTCCRYFFEMKLFFNIFIITKVILTLIKKGELRLRRSDKNL